MTTVPDRLARKETIATAPVPRSDAAEPEGWPYVDKHDPWSSHSRIQRWLAGLPRGTRVLDVGAATGILGRLVEPGHLVLSGLEPNPEWAGIAAPYYDEFFCGMLEETPDSYLAGHDVVVCADVIEHMPAPEPALRRLLDLQPERAELFVSVPNVANIWVRINLLFGRFHYGDRGILDRTHLRFFTRGSFIAMLEGLGLRVVRIEATPIPLDLVNPFFHRNAVGRALHRALAATTRVFPRLLGFQIAARAIKTP